MLSSHHQRAHASTMLELSLRNFIQHVFSRRGVMSRRSELGIDDVCLTALIIMTPAINTAMSTFKSSCIYEIAVLDSILFFLEYLSVDTLDLRRQKRLVSNNYFKHIRVKIIPVCSPNSVQSCISTLFIIACYAHAHQS